MATIEVKGLDGKKVESIELDDSVFGVEVNEHLLWEVVKAQRAKRRAGTHSTLRRGEVRGGGIKPYKQKGTGNARQGSTRAVQFVGGGKAFTPKPRDYEYSVPKKVMAGALRCALSLRAKESKIVVVKGFEFEKFATKKVVAALKTFGAKSALLVDAPNEKLSKSASNVQAAKYLRQEGLNVYDILNHETIIITKASIALLTDRLRTEGKKGSAA